VRRVRAGRVREAAGGRRCGCAGVRSASADASWREAAGASRAVRALRAVARPRPAAHDRRHRRGPARAERDSAQQGARNIARGLRGNPLKEMRLHTRPGRASAGRSAGEGGTAGCACANARSRMARRGATVKLAHGASDMAAGMSEGGREGSDVDSRDALCRATPQKASAGDTG
jgi:hypothetical protein